MSRTEARPPSESAVRRAATPVLGRLATGLVVTIALLALEIGLVGFFATHLLDDPGRVGTAAATLLDKPAIRKTIVDRLFEEIARADPGAGATSQHKIAAALVDAPSFGPLLQHAITSIVDGIVHGHGHGRDISIDTGAAVAEADTQFAGVSPSLAASVRAQPPAITIHGSDIPDLSGPYEAVHRATWILLFAAAGLLAVAFLFGVRSLVCRRLGVMLVVTAGIPALIAVEYRSCSAGRASAPRS